MPLPAYQDLITLSSRSNGLIPESIEERILTILAMLASGTGPDGTALPTFAGGALTATTINASGNIVSSGTVVGAAVLSQGIVEFANGLGILNEYGGSATPANTTLWFIAGVPNVAMGANGDWALRSDGTHATTSVLYHKEAGAWVGCA